MASTLFPQPNNPLKIIEDFRKFAEGMSPEGAKRKVEELLKNGRMSQEQFQSLSKDADALMRFLK